MITAEDTTLKHFGVKGMKWGIRKDRKGSSAGSASTLTNKELNKRIKRMDLEKRYLKLMDEKAERERSPAAKALVFGADQAGQIIGSIGKSTITGVGKAYVNIALNSYGVKTKKD